MGYRRVAAYTKRYEWNDEFFAGGTGDNGYLFTGWNESKTNLLTVGGEMHIYLRVEANDFDSFG